MGWLVVGAFERFWNGRCVRSLRGGSRWWIGWVVVVVVVVCLVWLPVGGWMVVWRVVSPVSVGRFDTIKGVPFDQVGFFILAWIVVISGMWW